MNTLKFIGIQNTRCLMTMWAKMPTVLQTSGADNPSFSRKKEILCSWHEKVYFQLKEMTVWFWGWHSVLLESSTLPACTSVVL